MSHTASHAPSPHRMNLAHAVFVGAAVIAFFVIVFWAGAAVGALHALPALSGSMSAGDAIAWVLGVLIAIFTGAFVGLVVALVHNALWSPRSSPTS